MGKQLNLTIRWQPKQAQLWQLCEQAQATWLGYGGSRGGSKSAAIRRVNLARRMQYAGSRSLILRRTFEEVYENHIQKYFEEWPCIRDWYSVTHKAINWPNGSVTKFGYAEHAGDIKAFQGQEYMDIFPDEATHFTEDELRFLKTCNRAPGFDDAKCKMVLTCNPGNVGHGFIKRVFPMPGNVCDYHENERAEDYTFIQAYAWDNIEWVRTWLESNGVSEFTYYSEWTDTQRFQCFVTHSTYGRELNALPQSMRVGHLLGRWDIFAGQYFDIFDRDKHVFSVEQMGIKDWHRRHISIDWGFAHPLVAYWHSTEGRVKKTYREYAAINKGPREAAMEIVSQSRLSNGSKEKIQVIYLSPDAFAKRTSEAPISEQMNDVFREAGLPSCTPANNDRIGGWMKMREGLKNGEWIIADVCTKLIKVLPMMTRDEDKREDCVKFDASEGQFNGDDAADAARYGIYENEKLTDAPAAERIAAVVAEMQKVCNPIRDGHVDYNIVAMQSRIAEEREKKKFQPVRRNRWRWGPPRQNVEAYR